RGTSACSRRCPATSTRCCAAARESASRSPGRKRMSSSSPAEPHLDVAELDEAAAIEDARAAERALGEVQARRGAGWVTVAWGLPGFVWLGFYLVAPLVFIILVSFWTRTDTGFVKTWTLSNYGDL